VAINATDFHLLLLLLQACNDDGKGHGINYERARRRRAASGDGGEGHAFNGGEALSLQVRRRAGAAGRLECGTGRPVVCCCAPYNCLTPAYYEITSTQSIGLASFC